MKVLRAAACCSFLVAGLFRITNETEQLSGRPFTLLLVRRSADFLDQLAQLLAVYLRVGFDKTGECVRLFNEAVAPLLELCKLVAGGGGLTLQVGKPIFDCRKIKVAHQPADELQLTPLRTATGETLVVGNGAA